MRMSHKVRARWAKSVLMGMEGRYLKRGFPRFHCGFVRFPDSGYLFSNARVRSRMAPLPHLSADFAGDLSPELFHVKPPR